jgi:hypothetical protein
LNLRLYSFPDFQLHFVELQKFLNDRLGRFFHLPVGAEEEDRFASAESSLTVEDLVQRGF